MTKPRVLKSATAYYARFVVTNESGDDMSPVTDGDFAALLRGGGSDPDIQLSDPNGQEGGHDNDNELGAIVWR